jgi:hypothetical protein
MIVLDQEHFLGKGGGMDTNNRASKLVSDAMKGREIAKGELVHRLGYSNLNKGRRRLEDFLESGEADPAFIEKLSDALELRLEDISKAMKEDREQKKLLQEKLEREAFKPYVFLLTEERRPLQITMFALAGGVGVHKMFLLPDGIQEKPWEKQLKIVNDMSKECYRKKKGKVLLFGKITGYLYCPTYDSSYQVGLDGKTDGINHGHFNLPRSSASIS